MGGGYYMLPDAIHITTLKYIEYVTFLFRTSSNIRTLYHQLDPNFIFVYCCLSPPELLASILANFSVEPHDISELTGHHDNHMKPRLFGERCSWLYRQNKYISKIYVKPYQLRHSLVIIGHQRALGDSRERFLG